MPSRSLQDFPAGLPHWAPDLKAAAQGKPHSVDDSAASRTAPRFPAVSIKSVAPIQRSGCRLASSSLAGNAGPPNRYGDQTLSSRVNRFMRNVVENCSTNETLPRNPFGHEGTQEACDVAVTHGRKRVRSITGTSG